ncbi:GNAT family N-acetyltransferase [Stenotrophobium rhamnosiphilum]|uniref:GNAT family N-acetyltransferase n=1 Tax=Stenotrophobium rhamnosiphilum TaxID=2029166 RepID=A0A2T5MIZ9_9GAMM|nr:GNAT family N-acetyltransferase [Stenotrophobium rhamnosiphilum]PTU32552.1 GNAT family N-acetyltransferase [Stenotrophobium rhamnosiphilum]
MSIKISPLHANDREAWETLARAYKAFYQTETAHAEYDQAWQRLLAHEGVFGLAARLDDKIVGISHHLFHASAWANTVCYLQDMYTAPEVRGRGVGRALISAVADHARKFGAVRYYWH